MYTGFGVDTSYARFALALFLMGAGMGLAMSPATEAIMGALPKAKAGVGSAMNDVVREIGGTLGVAILGSVLNSRFASGMDGSVDRARARAGARRRRLGRRRARGRRPARRARPPRR